MQKNIVILIFFSILSMANSTSSKEETKVKLLTILKDVKEYKLKKNHQIKKLHSEIEKLHKELKKLKTKLSTTNQKLTKTEEKLAKKETEVLLNIDKRIDMAMDEPEIITLDILQNSLESETLVPNKMRLKPSVPSFERTLFEPQKISENRETKLSWVEIVVEDSMDIYQLALKYYNDREGYQNIYSANQNIIGNNLIIEDGMSLKIPIVDNFEEQPIVLNRH